jgi:hypothetical protein
MEKNPWIKNSVPMPSDDRPRWIPRTMNLILVFLKTDEPPTANPHAQEGEDAS